MCGSEPGINETRDSPQAEAERRLPWQSEVHLPANQIRFCDSFTASSIYDRGGPHCDCRGEKTDRQLGDKNNEAGALTPGQARLLCKVMATVTL